MIITRLPLIVTSFIKHTFQTHLSLHHMVLLCFTALCRTGRGLMKHWPRVPAASSMSMQCSLIASVGPAHTGLGELLNFVGRHFPSSGMDLSTFINSCFIESQPRNTKHEWSDIPMILMRCPQKITNVYFKILLCSSLVAPEASLQHGLATEQ